MLLALGVLLVLFPLIGKYQDISHQAQMASRYVAWQSTVRNDADGGSFASADEMARDVRKRFFGPTTSRIFTGDAASDTPRDRNPMWTDHKGRPLLQDFGDVKVSFGAAGSTDPTAGFNGGGSLSGVYPTLSPGTFGLSNRGIFRGTVEVRLANLDVAWLAPFDNLNLSITRHTSIMPDSWAVASAERVESRVTDSQANFPSTPLKAPALIVTLPVMALEDNRIKPPELGKVDFWRDTVPADRLK
ncbi:hypothetical protein OOT46_22980 [Aquabacterium sp. A7-Y]|uniref:hypothetical protein n=1 Tax=Aquabacterium sp. A7-Y TaxID=1349605 RepID=UPI00223CC26F|nr:hypothetical protein [Aquabacterium sp. A7-Y]MCW7540687.1 hypothetical protein [Aquabacterium sp. A7-Y]